MLAALLVVVVGAALGVVEWRRIARRVPSVTIETALRHAPHVVAVLPLALGLLAVQVVAVSRPDFTWNLPLWLEYHYDGLVLGGVLGAFSFLFTLTSYGAYAGAHPRRGSIAGAALALTGVVGFVQLDITAPIASELIHLVKDGVVLQTSGSSCAAASAANLLARHGQTRTEREMAELLGTTRYGTSAAQIVYGLARVGFACRKIEGSNDGTKVKTPAILLVESASGAVLHAVLLDHADANAAEVLDPLIGRQRVPLAELAARWSGRAIECDPPAP